MLPKPCRSLFVVFILLIGSWSESSTLSCRRAYEFTKSEYIEFYHLEELVHLEGRIVRGIVLSGNQFSVKDFKSLDDAKVFYSNIPVESRRIVTQVIETRTKDSETSLARVRALSLRYGGILSFRVKSPGSLKAKIFDRTMSFSKTGKAFTLEDLADIVGVRVVVPLESPLLTTTDAAFWGRELGVDPLKIKEIEMKGSAQDRAKGRYYTALHLNLEVTGRIEIQIMTEPMSIWHKWDHAQVYKPLKKVDPNVHEKLKLYSQSWSRIIAELDSLPNGVLRSNRLSQILSEFGIFEAATPDSLNQLLLAKFGLSEKDGIARDRINRILEIYF